MRRHATAIIVFLIALIGFSGYYWQKPPKVSVVMLTYKRADLLSNAINSILNQTNKDFELIIINDGSDDNTADIVKQFHDSRIRYYENDRNRGIPYSRNKAMDLARGKYVMITDDDDINLPNRIQLQADYLDNHPEIDAVAGQIKGFPHSPLEHDEIALGLIHWNNFGNPNVMYRRSFTKLHNIRYNEKLNACEDWEFWLQMLFKGAHFASITEDVIIRNGDTVKHYNTDFGIYFAFINSYVEQFFSPNNPMLFKKASPCEKLRLIAPKKIISTNYMVYMQTLNCP